MNEVESMDDDVVTFDLADTVKKVIEELKQRIKCSITAIEGIVSEGQLRSVYQKFRADLESLLKTDAKQCLETSRVTDKLKWVNVDAYVDTSIQTMHLLNTPFRCALSVTQKLNKLYAELVQEVRKVGSNDFWSIYFSANDFNSCNSCL